VIDWLLVHRDRLGTAALTVGLLVAWLTTCIR
jgi:hypothetical protein